MNGYKGAVLLALSSVARHRRRGSFCIAAIACGMAATILAGGFIQWIFWAAREGAIASGLGHIEVQRRVDADAPPGNVLLQDDEPELSAMRQRPGVRTVAQRRKFSGLVSHGDITVSFLGEGVDPASETRFGTASVVVQGQPIAPEDPNGALVGEGLAANLGVTVGDVVVLLARTAEGSINATEVTVRGLIRTVSKSYDDAAIRIPIAAANRLIRKPGADTWLIVLEKTADTDDTAAALRGQYGQKLTFVPWHERADFYQKTVSLLSRQMLVVKVVIALVVMLIIANSLMMAVMERTSEIGTCMALGATSRAILAQFSLEAALLGVVGAVVGAALGVALAELISSVGIPMPPPPGQSRGYVGRMLVTKSLVGEAALLAMGTALLAGIMPALTASRTEIVSALRAGR